ncbi:hypothetical protein FB563_4272 [Streptomyces puniciscabiei]|uniref:PPE family protein n=1 Tax=Streptomyces puniciscabiei TaxID=164348 RepID=A0A542UJG9_9ACTN|nr:hypothetical protein FB563_4272 [Streptomyces puniciscabiei]
MSDFVSRMWETVRQERFLLQDPEQLWAMVESADGPTVSGLGELLKEAAKTIREIGGDLRTHSMAVEWEGEGGAAFRTWCYQAALTTVSLGDYSENAGKWLGHAADTLHEVKPQLEILRKQSAGPRSVLEAHAAKATDVGDHGGGPSDSAVAKAKTQYANTRAEAGGLMMKLAQSYTASTEQISALKAPTFPELPQRFVPDRFGGETHISAPTDGGKGTYPGTPVRTEVPARQTTVDSTVSRTSPVPRASVPHHPADVASVTDVPLPRHHVEAANTVIDSTGTLPSPVIPASPSTPPVGAGGSPDGRTPVVTGPLPPAFGTGTPLPPSVRGGSERPVYGVRGPLATPSGPGTSAGPRIPGRGFSGPYGPGATGGQPGAGPVPTGSPSARSGGGITGGRPVSPTPGRPGGAFPRGNVIGGTPNEQQAPSGRGAELRSPAAGAMPARDDERSANREGVARGRMPASSNGIVGGQPRPSRDRKRAGFTSRGVRPASEASADEPPQQRGGPSRGASTPIPKRDDRSARARRTSSCETDQAEDREHQAEENAEHQAEEKKNRPLPPPLPKGPDGDLGREG